MDKKQIVVGVTILILVALSLFFWFRATIPSPTEIEQTTSPIQLVEKDLLKKPTVQNILRRDLNGNVPFVVDSSQLGRDDPFANY